MYLYEKGSSGINVPFEVLLPTCTSKLRFHPNHPGRHLQVELLGESEKGGVGEEGRRRKKGGRKRRGKREKGKVGEGGMEEGERGGGGKVGKVIEE